MKTALKVSMAAILLASAIAQAGTSPAPKGKPAQQAPEQRRATSLSFEDDVIENINNPRLDSLDLTRNRLDGSDNVLYMKRKDYRSEIRQMINELRYTP